MTKNSEVVASYGKLASRVAHMAELARARQWGQLPELEAACAARVDELKAMTPVADLEAHELELVRALVEGIRSDQDEVCRLVKVQLEYLMTRMAQMQRSTDLDRAYGLSA